MPDKSLIELGRIPSLDELKAYFKKHDWSAAKLSEPQSRSADKAAGMKEIKKIMNAEFEKLAREKGLGEPSKYLENKMCVKGTGGNLSNHQGNPLLELRDSTEDLVSDAVYEIAVNREDVLDGIFSQFDFTDPDIEKKADAFLHNAVGTMLDVMEYEKFAKLVREKSASEDFNPSIRPNFRAIEHERNDLQNGIERYKRRSFRFKECKNRKRQPDRPDFCNGNAVDKRDTVLRRYRISV